MIDSYHPGVAAGAKGSVIDGVDRLLVALAFVRLHAISVVSYAPGEVTIELSFDERFSGPATQLPASIVGTAGDVAAVSSCLSLLPKGWARATLDFTVKMTGDGPVLATTRNFKIMT